MKVSKIRNGIVIDHIKAGDALKVLKILGIDRDYEDTVTVMMNAESKEYGKKDIVKIENRELDKEDLDKISLLSPTATVNVIRGSKLAEKYGVKIPDEIEGVLECTNPECISNSEQVSTKFSIESSKPMMLRCHYCERLISTLRFK